MAAPLAILRTAKRQTVFVWGLAAIALAGVVSMVLVSTTDDAQAGFGFMVAPFLGSVAAGVALIAERVLDWRS